MTQKREERSKHILGQYFHPLSFIKWSSSDEPSHECCGPPKAIDCWHTLHHMWLQSGSGQTRVVISSRSCLSTNAERLHLITSKWSNGAGCYKPVYSLATVEEDGELHHFQLHPSFILFLRDTNLLNEQVGDDCRINRITKCAAAENTCVTHHLGHPPLSQQYRLDITWGTDFLLVGS
jgi:hypothetical protein